jgi:radical SAM superfamily enzyme YgiQ (UPF0313 family)
MINKVIVFGDFSSRDLDNSDKNNFLYFKSAAVLRIGYYLRQQNFNVKQVHHCNIFTNDELEQIISDFSKGDNVLICVTTSFLSNTINSLFLKKETGSVGSKWGLSFDFLLNISKLAKKFKFPIVLGGFELTKDKFQNLYSRKVWGIDILDAIGIDYYIYGNDISIIPKICKNETIAYEQIKSSKYVTVSDIVDFTNGASTPIIEDHIAPKECLITEVAAGCVFSCSFCTYSALGKRKEEFVRTYESLKNEIVDNYNNFGTRVYMLSDNMLNDYEMKLQYLKRIREETGINLRWIGYARLDVIKTKKQAQLLYDSGAAALIFGIESFKKEVGPYLGKMCDKDKLVQSLHLLREVGGDDLLLSAGFIAGAPTETKEELKETCDWLISDEGKYLIDQYKFITLFVSPDTQDNKNDINKARNSPYKDYTFENERDKIFGEFWTSPWGTYEEFDTLATELNTIHGYQRTVFSIPYIHNAAIQLGIEIEDLIKIFRFRKYNDYALQLKEMNNALLEKYKINTLAR